MMTEKSTIPKATSSVLALSVAEVLLALVGFAANFYNIFYGIFAADENVPMGQTLIFVVSIPLYGVQLACGARFMLASVRLMCGQRNSAFFDDGDIPMCEFGICQIWALFSCGLCLLASIFAWFMQVGFAANRLISSAKFDALFATPGSVAKPIPDAWNAVQQTFHSDLPGHMVMLGAILLLIASVIVVVFIIRQRISVRKELKSADLKADDRKASKEEHKLLAHSKQQNGTPPPPYSDEKMAMTV
ncbi:uncharacterized protein LOC129593160 [Paramacrobiotus metropolitanus]|uniref:uncharacterized protein LOC129593160 n=1 Tax=Paramacrobiotus metropolitanus TaxID=2943436 RepID=UPI0024460BF4|nr:uncharacterized protein LOC129593160 [Paramacrobiotus metropolitanus]